MLSSYTVPWSARMTTVIPYDLPRTRSYNVEILIALWTKDKMVAIPTHSHLSFFILFSSLFHSIQRSFICPFQMVYTKRPWCTGTPQSILVCGWVAAYTGSHLNKTNVNLVEFQALRFSPFVVQTSKNRLQVNDRSESSKGRRSIPLQHRRIGLFFRHGCIVYLFPLIPLIIF